MGISPPKPGFEGRALDIIRNLTWSALDADVGELSGGWLVVASEDDSAPAWHAGTAAAPAGVQPRLVTKDAFEAIRDGQLDGNGTIRWQGKRWRLADVAEGGRLVARLVLESKS